MAVNLSELFKACEPLDSPKKINNSLRGKKGVRRGALMGIWAE